MAAVSLKDLMNPLVKIAEYTQQTSTKLDQVVGLLTKSPSASGSSTISAKDSAKVSASMSSLADGTKKMVDALNDMNKVSKDSDKVSASMSSLADGTKKMIDALNDMNKVSKDSVDNFINVLKNTFKTFDKYDENKAVKGADAFVKVSEKLAEATKYIDKRKFKKFEALNLALSSRILLTSLTLVLVAYMGPVMVLGAVLFGVAVKLLVAIAGLGSIKGMIAMRSILAMAHGALKFSLTMVLVAVLSPIVLIGTVIFGVSLKLLTLFVGRSWKNIALFAALGLMGSSILQFTLTMVLLTFIFPYVLKGAIMFGAILAIMSFAIKLLGNPAKISLKAAMFFILTPAIVVFAVGMALAGAILGDDYGTYFSMMALLLGVSLLVKTLGKPKTFFNILLGSIALGVIGGALYAFNYGYEPFANTLQNLTFKDIAKQAAVLTGLTVGIIALGSFGLVPALLGSLALGAIGGSLIALAKGLQAIRDVGWTNDDSEYLFTTLAGIKLAFMGGPPPKGFFGSIGAVLGQGVDTAVMVASAVAFASVGLSLVALSKGLIAFQKVNWTFENSVSLTAALRGITGAFMKVGGDKESMKAIRRGIESVQGAGEALYNISLGLINFQKLLESEIVFGDPENPEPGTLGYAVKSAISFVSSAFSKVGEEKVGWFSESKVKKGVEAVSGAGAALKDIAIGLIEFQKIVKEKINWTELEGAISSSLKTVGEAFGAIGSQSELSYFGPFIWQGNTIAKGIDAVKGAGAALTDVAKGIISFNDLVKKKIKWDEVENAISKSLTIIGDAFAMIGGKKSEESWFFITWDTNLVQKGIEAVSGAGEVLKNIVMGLKDISEMANPEKAAKTLSTLLTSLGTNFATLYEENPDINDKMSKVATFVIDIGNQAKAGNLAKAAEGFQGITDAINGIELEKSNSLGNIFKYASELSKDEQAISRLAEAVDQIRNIMVAKEEAPAGPGLGEQISNAIFGGGGGETAQTEGEAGPALDLNRLNATLTSIESTLSNLPSAIASIEIRIPEE